MPVAKDHSRTSWASQRPRAPRTAVTACCRSRRVAANVNKRGSIASGTRSRAPAASASHSSRTPASRVPSSARCRSRAAAGEQRASSSSGATLTSSAERSRVARPLVTRARAPRRRAARRFRAFRQRRRRARAHRTRVRRSVGAAPVRAACRRRPRAPGTPTNPKRCRWSRSCERHEPGAGPRAERQQHATVPFSGNR